MKQLFALFFATSLTMSVFAQTAKDRVTHNDPSKYREISDVHAGAGSMGFTQLIGRNDLSTNFLYLHSGVINPKSGIGHHFHHTIEEMYVILNGEAEFTINGRTSKIKAPAIVPCKMGDAHGIYNASNEKLRWLNFAVSTHKARGDNFDLGDTREGAKLDPIPVFASGRLEKEKARANNRLYSGDGVLSRRIFGPDVFSTNWDHVDHVIIPAGKSTEEKQLLGYEEVYFVVNGSGTASIDGDQTAIVADDSFYAKLGEKTIFTNNGNEDLELLVIGIATSKEMGLGIKKPLVEPKAMVLQMDFVVPKENAEAFEKMYYSIYVPAMTVQEGYISSKLLRRYSDDLSKQIQAEDTNYNYQVQISFDTEANRMKWVGSEQHKIAWPAATSLSTEYKWRGYDVMGDDDQR
ncbi:cupin domain-containing protein [Flavobacteriaceae bacterium XHP0103]|uniref:cupin domain-containing protein n=1 Tax=Marixanthotalea marina TaxID=2844359 RepID=UPI002989D183|nr:cupin domain-containing protein [Marixanthotalea marina]MBU3822939.1 cupin domain-containing protein [Marixanthotalea marina]